jgi:NADH:ubiquinone oxidoreductase subunit D
VNWDVRKNDPYSVYPRLDFDVVVGDNGDAYDRNRCRLFECYESSRLIVQAISQMDGGAVMAEGVPRLIAPAPAEATTTSRAPAARSASTS